MIWRVDEFLSSSLVPRKVRFLTMTMFEQARHRSFDLMGTFFSHSSKSAFSHHDYARTSLTLFIWINENVLLSFLEKCVFSP